MQLGVENSREKRVAAARRSGRESSEFDICSDNAAAPTAQGFTDSTYTNQDATCRDRTPGHTCSKEARDHFHSFRFPIRQAPECDNGQLCRSLQSRDRRLPPYLLPPPPSFALITLHPSTLQHTSGRILACRSTGSCISSLSALAALLRPVRSFVHKQPSWPMGVTDISAWQAYSLLRTQLLRLKKDRERETESYSRRLLIKSPDVDWRNVVKA